MIHYVSFSGGRTSAYLVMLFEKLKKMNPELDVRYIFMDTGAEHPDTYRFIKDVVKHFEINLIVLRVSINPILHKANSYEIIELGDMKRDLSIWSSMLKKYGSPAINIPFCTGRMKTEPYEKFVKDDSQGNEYFTWLGIRADEPRRLKPKLGIGYLAHMSDVDKSDILKYWSAYDWDLHIPENLGNCEFCIKKDPIKIALAERYEPKHAEEWAKVVESDKVRIEGRVLQDYSMYRHRNTFSKIIKMFEDTTTEELETRVLKSKRYDSGSCSESCEAI